MLDAELARDRTHVQLANIARVAALALGEVEVHLSVVRLHAKPHTEVARMELKNKTTKNKKTRGKTCLRCLRNRVMVHVCDVFVIFASGRCEI